MYYGPCSIRLLADLALAASFPMFTARIIKKGNAGISATSQTLHLLVFILRYTDLSDSTLFFDSSFSLRDLWPWQSTWTAVLKVYLVLASAAVLVAMTIRAWKDRQTRLYASTRHAIATILKESVLYLFLAFVIAYRINYTRFGWVLSPGASRESAPKAGLAFIVDYFSAKHWPEMTYRDIMEIGWAASIYLAAIADIPQYKKFYSYTRYDIDWSLMTPIMFLAGSRSIYIVHWTIRFISENFLDPIAFFSGIVQAVAFWLFFILTISRANSVLSEDLSDLEAQLAEYDAERWGEEPDNQAIFDAGKVEK